MPPQRPPTSFSAPSSSSTAILPGVPLGPLVSIPSLSISTSSGDEAGPGSLFKVLFVRSSCCYNCQGKSFRRVWEQAPQPPAELQGVTHIPTSPAAPWGPTTHTQVTSQLCFGTRSKFLRQPVGVRCRFAPKSTTIPVPERQQQSRLSPGEAEVCVLG